MSCNKSNGTFKDHMWLIISYIWKVCNEIVSTSISLSLYSRINLHPTAFNNQLQVEWEVHRYCFCFLFKTFLEAFGVFVPSILSILRKMVIKCLVWTNVVKVKSESNLFVLKKRIGSWFNERNYVSKPWV